MTNSEVHCRQSFTFLKKGPKSFMEEITNDLKTRHQYIIILTSGKHKLKSLDSPIRILLKYLISYVDNMTIAG